MNLPGSPLEGASMERRIRQSIRALGVHEVQTLTLTSEARDFEAVRLNSGGAVTRIRNPITREHGILRQSVLPSLLSVLAANRHHELPHRIFELGAIVVDHNNSTSVAWACAERNAGFTSAKGYALSLLRDLGSDESEIVLSEGAPGYGPWLAGRVAVVNIGGREIGSFGEIDPSISSVFGLRVPVHAGEFDVHALTELLPDPLA
jgi:phenylalanyl-tRNA synthetase beta chain